MKFQVCDIYTYTPADSWCRHGIALILDDGRPSDTYWTGLNVSPFQREHGDLWHPEMLAQLNGDSRIGNVADFRNSNRDECQNYEDSESLFIPIGSGSEQWMLRISATPSIDKSFNHKFYQLEKAVYEADGAVYKMKQLIRELNSIRQQQWERDNPQTTESDVAK